MPNVPAYIQHCNGIIDADHLGANARFITDDEVQRLVTANNPDGEGRDPAWLSGPGPINYWRTHFARTIADPKHHGVVRMMVVNTHEQCSLHDALSCEHWILIAWFIEPAAASGSANA